MSISSIRNQIAMYEKQIADLDHKMSLEIKKESDLYTKITHIQNSITKNTSESTYKSKMSEIARKRDEIARVNVKKASLSKDRASKTSYLTRYNNDLQREILNERKKEIAETKRLQKEQLDFQKKLNQERYVTQESSRNVMATASNDFEYKQLFYDLFISHASEDKEGLVRPLVIALQELDVKVWYDEFTLKIGDSLRRNIDSGLRNSRYGVIILSNSFFEKQWPQYELDGMVSREMQGKKVILPIWHKVTKDEVMNYSPSMADKVALNTSLFSIKELAIKLAEVIME
ncbi:MAG: toll/interleukin-1 receptor domain-containing protein [Crenarchaeota archaeon]|nr:toll/interleukin-1 receptor domain-containing protein [Thermoproteota archaeon]